MDCASKSVIKVVNSIKAKALQLILEKNCENMASSYVNRLYRTSKMAFDGWRLERVFQLKAELLMYLQDEKSEYENLFANSLWFLKLAFLADIFEHLNIDYYFSSQGFLFYLYV